MALASSSSRWRRIADKTLDILLPPLCLACSAPVGSDRSLCPDCWKQIHFLAPPFCVCCGAPFEAPVGDGLLCAACIARPPHFTAARGAMLYDDASKRLILGFKHGDHTHPARTFASWMYRAGETFWETTDYLVPVPLHRWRLFRRRYNQAALLAHELGIRAHKPVLADALVRRHATPAQGHRSRKERQENVRGAFALNPRCREIEGKTIMLVDDVLTTGATADECSRILTAAGARAVNVLTLARVRAFV